LLYDGSYKLQSLTFGASLLLLLLGMLLGYGGARMAVGRHLRDIEPS